MIKKEPTIKYYRCGTFVGRIFHVTYWHSKFHNDIPRINNYIITLNILVSIIKRWFFFIIIIFFPLLNRKGHNIYLRGYWLKILSYLIVIDYNLDKITKYVHVIIIPIT